MGKLCTYKTLWVLLIRALTSSALNVYGLFHVVTYSNIPYSIFLCLRCTACLHMLFVCPLEHYCQYTRALLLHSMQILGHRTLHYPPLLAFELFIPLHYGPGVSHRGHEKIGKAMRHRRWRRRMEECVALMDHLSWALPHFRKGHSRTPLVLFHQTQRHCISLHSSFSLSSLCLSLSLSVSLCSHSIHGHGGERRGEERRGATCASPPHAENHMV